MKVGITLPQFNEDTEAPIEVALDAEAAGLDGVFVFDHLWPMGQPHRPALHSQALLGALAASTQRLVIGSLVARVGLVPDAVLVNALATVHRMVGDRLIAGVGTGDRLSAAENVAYGVSFEPAAARLDAVARVCDGLRAQGVTTWIGGRSAATREVARGHADALNLWDAPVEEVAAERETPVTWGGLIRPETDLPAHLGALAEAGAAWAVLAPVGFAWDEAVAVVASAAQPAERRH
jgi:alkanesulfonate monooxygenase SsuD/methylene tetrahydromethanopterin reductase-like flavin-dependent oxidoreductase (luciferase family)